MRLLAFQVMWTLSALLVQEAEEERDPIEKADGFQVGVPAASPLLRSVARAPLAETVMAVPKKRTSKMKTRSRKANWFAKARVQASKAWSRAKSAGYDPLEDPKYSFNVEEEEEDDDDEEEASPSRAGEPQMSGRRNLKKEKRIRNRVNAFKFKKPAPRFWNRNRGNSPQDSKQAQEDAEFMSLIFTKSAEEAAQAAEAAAEEAKKPRGEAPQKEARSPEPVMMLAEEIAEELAAVEMEAALEAAEDTAALLHFLRRSNPAMSRAGTPAMSAVDEVMDALKSMTLLEASELVKQIEETFDVDASVGGGMMMAAPMAGGAAAAGGAEAAAEKTEFDLVLEAFPADKKIAVLKIVRELTGLGLKDAKEKVEAAPCALKEGAPKAECEEALKKLEEAGATAALK